MLLFGLTTAQAAEDQRSPLLLNADERGHVLEEMRTFLTSAHGVLQGVLQEDADAIAQAARKAGRAAAHAVPQSLRAKLPMQFMKLGSDTHQRFDQLAMDAESLGDASHSLQQLTELMGNCLACHDLYRIDVQP
ncbi:cytochrome c [Magnetovirga frankeli]|uniref:cytochrome c n=1 Tax=Magnetovirga frankeli TaxID=947516 RepID=UPI0012932434|nr:cytochrome c [gamma proteobacterium SS-5]